MKFSFRLDIRITQCFFKAIQAIQLKTFLKYRLVVNPALFFHKGFELFAFDIFCFDFMKNLISVGFAPCINLILPFSDPVDQMLQCFFYPRRVLDIPVMDACHIFNKMINHAIFRMHVLAKCRDSFEFVIQQNCSDLNRFICVFILTAIELWHSAHFQIDH